MGQKFLTKAFAVGTALIFLSGSAVAATEPTLLGTYGDWDAYVSSDGGSKFCFMNTQPVKSKGNYTRRGDVFVSITHWKSTGASDVVSIATGYSYKVGSTAKIKIGSNKFSLFTQKETAWAYDPETDTKIAKAVQAGSTMTVKGTSTRGTLTTDTYSLKGSSAAYKAISKACKM